MTEEEIAAAEARLGVTFSDEMKGPGGYFGQVILIDHE